MDAEKTLLMDQVQYARHRGTSKQYINKLKHVGILVMRAGKIDVRASDQVLDDRPLPEIPDPTPGDGAPQRTTYSEARTIRTIFQAKLARLDFETKEGKLIDAEDVRQRVAGHVDQIRGGLAALVDRLTPMLTKESDAKKVHAIMKREIRAELVRLSATLRGGPDAGAPPEA
jgi:hypothetical protein